MKTYFDPFADLVCDSPLIRRRDAAQATLHEWGGKKLRLGHADCVRMVASHLRRLGHKVVLPPAGSYRSVKAAKAALAKAGYACLPDALDSFGFERIAPAAALVGDIIELPSAIDGLAALTVAVGNGRVIGWCDDGREGVLVMQPHEYVAAWRVAPAEGE